MCNFNILPTSYLGFYNTAAYTNRRRHQLKTASVLKRNKDSLLWSRYERCYHLSSLRTLDGYQLYTRALLMLQRFITHINYLSFKT